MYFLYSLGGVTFNKCWITLLVLNCYSPNFQGFILMKNALNNQVGMLGDIFLWLLANLKQGVIYFIKQGSGNHKIAWVYMPLAGTRPKYSIYKEGQKRRRTLLLLYEITGAFGHILLSIFFRLVRVVYFGLNENSVMYKLN